METKAKRTLVKSAPELWEFADDLERMESWMGGFVGRGSVEVEVTERVPGRVLVWRAADAGSEARIAMALADRGFGTAVEITANHEGEAPRAVSALERLLDELGSPERRPFAAA